MVTDPSVLTSQQLRDRIAGITENLDDMVKTLLRLADRDGWADEKVARLDGDIRWWENRRKALRDELKRRARDVA